MERPLTEREIEIAGFLCQPDCLTENLIPIKEHSPQVWNGIETECIWLRHYQMAMQNYSYLYANDPKLSPKENVQIKKGAGDLASIGARNLGKSFELKIDLLLSVIHNVTQICLASFDAEHLGKIAGEIADYLESHPFMKIFHLKDSRQQTVKRKQGVQVITEHGTQVRSVNEKVESPKEKRGTGYQGLHFDTRYFEEFSFSSPDGERQAVDACNSLGFIDRPSGIPDLCMDSPLGKILENPKRKNWIWRLPQSVREDYDEQTEQRLIEEYKGLSSAAYKLNVLAETIEGAFGWYDMSRLKEASLDQKRTIKFLEVSNDTFNIHDKKLIVDRLAGTEKIIIAADIGFGPAPTEIIILFFDGKKWIYEYNISVFRLLQKEQAIILKFLYDKLGGAFISVDSTSDEGATLDYLKDMGVPVDHLLKVKFNENIEVDFEYKKDEQGNYLLDSEEKKIVLIDDNGNPVMKEANTLDWAMSELNKIMYNGTISIPLDPKFLTQFTNTFATKLQGMKLKYGNKGSDHLHAAWQVFAICRFFNEFKILKNHNQTPTKRGFYSFGKKQEKI